MKGEKIELNGEVLDELIANRTLKSRERLAKEIGVSPGTITHATTPGMGVSRETYQKIINGLSPSQEELDRLVRVKHISTPAQQIPPPEYMWRPTVEDAASSVINQLFGEGKFNPDAILTFAGASAIFANLCLAKLSDVKQCLRTPIYTAILDQVDAPDRQGYHKWVTTETKRNNKQFAIFIPIALTDGFSPESHKIVVIDDVIISGKTMETLREKFQKELDYPREHLQFACFYCWEPRLKDYEQPPEIVIESSRFEKVTLPWGDSFCFEDHVPEKTKGVAAGLRSESGT